jgi:hypothetical protein
MHIEYVGPKPIVDNHGITFDKSEPDRYVFLYAVVELLEIIEECVSLPTCSISDDGVVDISQAKGIYFADDELIQLVKKHCDSNLENIIEKKENRTQELIQKLKNEVYQNQTLQEDDKTAWIGNIDVMKEYYMQFIQNEIVYECLLNVLADDIYKKKIKEIKFSLGKNYGFVFSYLQNVLSEHKPPLDADVKMDVENGKTIGRFFIKHPQKSSF